MGQVKLSRRFEVRKWTEMLPAMPLQQISVTPLDWQKQQISVTPPHWLKQPLRGNVSVKQPSRASVSEPNRKCKREPVYTATAASERCSSQASTLFYNGDICRICHCESEPDAPLFSPCYCSGSLRYVHQICLQQWIKRSGIRCCELCRFEFIMQSKPKPLLQWELLELTNTEWRKLYCRLFFHSAAIACVLWALYVLIERTLYEVNSGLLEWPFWTKLIIVAVGSTGGIVFVSLQCRSYVALFRRWKAFNRFIYVESAPEKRALEPSPTPSLITSQESLLISGPCCGSAPVDMTAADAPARSVSVLDLSDDSKHNLHPQVPAETLAASTPDVAVIPLENIPITLDVDVDINDLSDIAPPPAAFSDAVDDADPPSPIPAAPSPSSSTAPPQDSFAFPLSRMGSGRLSAGYPLLLSTFHPCTPEARFRGCERPEPAPDTRIASMGEDVAVTIRPWTVGGSYFLHPAHTGHGLSERWMEIRGGSRGADRRDSLPVEAVCSSVPLASVVPPELGDMSFSNVRSHRID